MNLELITKLLNKRTLKPGTVQILEKFKSRIINQQDLTQGQVDLLKRISAENGIVIEEASAPRELVEVKGSCGKCRDGLILAYNSDAALYVFICPCDVGSRRPEQYPNWRNYESTNTYRIDKPGTNPRFDEPWKKVEKTPPGSTSGAEEHPRF